MGPACEAVRGGDSRPSLGLENHVLPDFVQGPFDLLF